MTSNNDVRERYSLKLKSLALLLPLTLYGCSSLPSDFSVYPDNASFLEAIAKFNAPKFFPPKLIRQDLGSHIDVVATHYNDVGGNSNMGYGPVAPQSRLSVAINKYCKDKGGNDFKARVVATRNIQACANQNELFIAIHFNGKGLAGADTGLQYADYHYIAIYSVGSALNSEIANVIAENYLRFERQYFHRGLVNVGNLHFDELAETLTKLESNS